jgi:hypothetical protein
MNGPVKRGFWDRVQQGDPRLLYALFAVLMVVLEFHTARFPIPVPPYVNRLYQTIENLQPGKIVILDSSMDAGWYPEARGAFEVIVRHLFKRGLPFAVFTNTSFFEGQRLGPQIVESVAREMGKEYGRDYCIWGAIVLAQGAGLQSLAKDIPGQVKVDAFGRPLSEIPMMRNVKDIQDVGLIFSVCYSWESVQWLGFVRSVYGTPYAVGTSAISSSTAYPYLDSGQIVGMIPGAAGAASYERLLKTPGSATRIAAVQSFAVLYVLGAIALGNAAMALAALQKRRSAGGPPA